MTPIKSQIFGLLLALFTAIGCIFYEKLVQQFSMLTVLIIMIVEFIILGVITYLFFSDNNTLNQDFTKLFSEKKYIFWAVMYVFTGLTTIFWYHLTKDQNVMVSSIYEMKYIAILAFVYIFFGEYKFTLNTAIGALLAIASIYFISKK